MAAAPFRPEKGGVLYEFACQPCGNRESRQHSIKSPPALGLTVVCPGCGGMTLRRVLSLPSIASSALQAARKYPYTSHRWSNDDLGGGCRETPEGHPIVESAQHEAEIKARTGMVRD